VGLRSKLIGAKETDDWQRRRCRPRATSGHVIAVAEERDNLASFQID
jgi:hypothetical protein